MPLPPAIELPCTFEVVEAASLSPFGWALLEVVARFSEGERPDFELLAGKLQIMEPEFLQQAWDTVVGAGAVTSRDFASATLTDRGSAALQAGYFVTGYPRQREGTFYFLERDGEVVRRRRFRVTELGLLEAAPIWAQRITPSHVAAALSEQAESLAGQLQPSERLTRVDPRWEAAQRVRLE